MSAPTTAMTVMAPARPPGVLELTFEQMKELARHMAASGLFGVKTPEQALSLMMLAQAEGMHPAMAVQEFDIINGKPSRKAERILARFQMSGGRVEWRAHDDEEVVGFFSHPHGADVLVSWTIERARTAGLLNKGGVWKTYPRAMLRARVISEGCKACYPAYALVTLSSEEAIDLGPGDYTVSDPLPPAEPAAEASATSKLVGAAAKAAIAEISQAIAACTTLEALEDCWQGAADTRSRIASQNARYGLEEIYEQRKHALTAASEDAAYLAHLKEADPIAYEAEMATRAEAAPPASGSPFEALMTQGRAVANAFPPDKRQAFGEWRKRITPDQLGRCTPEERAALKSLHDEIKREVEAAATAPAEGRAR